MAGFFGSGQYNQAGHAIAMLNSIQSKKIRGKGRPRKYTSEAAFVLLCPTEKNCLSKAQRARLPNAPAGRPTRPLYHKAMVVMTVRLFHEAGYPLSECSSKDTAFRRCKELLTGNPCCRSIGAVVNTWKRYRNRF